MKLKRLLSGLTVLGLVGCAQVHYSETSSSSSQAPSGSVATLMIPQERAEQYDRNYGERYIQTQDRAYQIFREYGVNPTILTQAQTQSTFAMDVDDGSYRLALSMLNKGQMPHAAGIRVEEFVNAQRYQYAANNELFALSAEVMPSPFREGYHVLHVGVQAKNVDASQRPPANLVLVADVSGSMEGANMELQKQAFSTLVAQLDDDDRVAIVAYSDNARVVLKPTSGGKQRQIIGAINRLEAGGSTNAALGLTQGYQMAESMLQPGFINRVVFTSDGLANTGATSPEAIISLIRRQKDQGIFMTTVGIGDRMYNDAMMEQLANQGNGHYLFIGNQYDIQRAFVDNFMSQMHVVAKNAKVQVEFDPSVVSHYRLLGYENRGLNNEDFADSRVDGGELGSGHRVTALYEVKLVNTKKDLGKFSIAYQKPYGQQVFFINRTISSDVIKSSVANSSSDMKLSAAAAAFAEKLRLSYWSSRYDYQTIDGLLASLPLNYQSSEQVRTLRDAIATASQLDRRVYPYQTSQNTTVFNLDHVPLLK